MKKNITLIAAAVVAALGLPLAAQAEGNNGWSGGYLGLDAGQAHFGNVDNTVNSNTANSTTHFSDNDTGWRLNLGAQFNPYFGAELSYVDFGAVNDNLDFGTPSNSSFHSQRRARAYGIAGVGTMPFGDSDWSGFLRLGTVDGHVQTNNTSIGFIPAPSSNTTSNDWRAYYGAGVNWAFSENWMLRAGWDQYHNLGNENTGGQTNINFASLGLVLRF